MYNQYIAGLISLRRELNNIIDSEIEEAMRGRGSSEKLKDSLEYRLEEAQILHGRYKEHEAIKAGKENS